MWRGELAFAEDRAAEAMHLLSDGSVPWFRALIQAVIAAGKLGRVDHVEACAELDPRGHARGGRGGASRFTSVGMAATHLVFGGRYASAEALFKKIEHAAGDFVAKDPMLQQTRAILATYAGDSVACLAGFTAALAGMEETRDRRNACSIRANLGYMLAELGDFDGAEEALRTTLGDANRMGLFDVATVALHNLGHVLAYCGQLDEARALELRAVEAFQRQGDLRGSSAWRTPTSPRSPCSRAIPSLRSARRRAAADALRIAPPLRAAAVANLARALIEMGRAEEALPIAREAFATLESLGMIEEGESLVRPRQRGGAPRRRPRRRVRRRHHVGPRSAPGPGRQDQRSRVAPPLPHGRTRQRAHPGARRGPGVGERAAPCRRGGGRRRVTLAGVGSANRCRARPRPDRPRRARARRRPAWPSGAMRRRRWRPPDRRRGGRPLRAARARSSPR